MLPSEARFAESARLKVGVGADDDATGVDEVGGRRRVVVGVLERLQVQHRARARHDDAAGIGEGAAVGREFEVRLAAGDIVDEGRGGAEGKCRIGQQHRLRTVEGAGVADMDQHVAQHLGVADHQRAAGAGDGDDALATG